MRYLSSRTQISWVDFELTPVRPKSALATLLGVSYRSWETLLLTPILLISGQSIAQNADPVGTPVITGEARQSATVTLDISGVADPNGLGSASGHSAAWSVANGGAALDGTTLSVVLPDFVVGQQIEAEFNFTVGGGTEVNVLSDPWPTSGTIAANTVPTRDNEIPSQTATVGTSFSYTFPANTFSDADNDTLIYSATLTNSSILPT